MRDRAEGILQARICRLKELLEQQREAGTQLEARSILYLMNERVVLDTEGRLFRLQRLIPPWR